MSKKQVRIVMVVSSGVAIAIACLPGRLCSAAGFRRKSSVSAAGIALNQLTSQIFPALAAAYRRDRYILHCGFHRRSCRGHVPWKSAAGINIVSYRQGTAELASVCFLQYGKEQESYMWQRMTSAFLLLLLLFCTSTAIASAETLTECQELFRKGDYEACLAAVATAVEERKYGEDWPILKVQVELILGKYPEALESAAAGIERYAWSVRLRQIQYEAALANGNTELADEALVRIEQMVSASSWRYTDADDLVALGKVALVVGADARAVQEGFYERARRNYSTRPDGFVAAAGLALEKGDPQMAVDLLEPVLEKFSSEPAVLLLLSEALESGNSARSADLLQQTLMQNPNYYPALIKLADRAIDKEDYSGATAQLDLILALNPHHPEAHALKSVIAHLQNRPEDEEAERAAALKYAARSPLPDFTIGRKLSRKYRFSEGAAAQRRALEFDEKFVPAMAQLAEDLLRLGQEQEGWELAESAATADPYNATLFNLLQLRDSLGRFRLISSEHFEVRMEAREADIYGDTVLNLLERAWDEATVRYDFEPQLPVRVEIYHRIDDFAVRTFGIPDVAGFLGVCFGQVITVNSPASRRDTPSDWQSVLWHEFFHVVTLQKTGNRIPRWLSEGISVYEERRINPLWGQRMSPGFRERVRQDQVTPVDQLSGAFLNADSGEAMSFAYYQSSMVVEHLIERHGLPAMNAVLTDLKLGLNINDALDRHCGGLESLQQSFSESLQTLADEYAPDAIFDAESLAAAEPSGLDEILRFCAENPGHIPALAQLAALLQGAGKQNEAIAILEQMIKVFPEDESSTSARTQLAAIRREQGETAEEMRLLAEQLQYSGDDLGSALRLQELRQAAEEWDEVVALGRRIHAIDPFRTAAIERWADAAERSNAVDSGKQALLTLTQLQPDREVRLLYRLAELLRQEQPQEARRFVLLALERAPRFREAHRLLLELRTEASAAESAGTGSDPQSEGNADGEAAKPAPPATEEDAADSSPSEEDSADPAASNSDE